MIDTVADSSKKPSSFSSEDHTQIKEMIQHFWNIRTPKTNKTIKHAVTERSSTFSNASAVSAPKRKFIPMEFIMPRWVSSQLSITRTAQSDQNTAAKPRPQSFAKTHVEQNITLIWDMTAADITVWISNTYTKILLKNVCYWKINQWKRLSRHVF